MATSIQSNNDLKEKGFSDARVVNVVDRETCRGCGVCGRVCPAGILEVRDRQLVIRDDRPLACIRCGQCVAACPTGSMHLVDVPDGRFSPVPERPFGDAELMAFLQGRRSVRRFKDRPVDRALLDRILELAATAPMGGTGHSTEVIVVDRREIVEQVREAMRQRYAKLRKALGSPIGRMVVRRKVGRETFEVVRTHVVDVTELAEELRAEGRDKYTYGAPALLVFHADPREVAAENNAHIVATYAMLAAHALGLGATWMDLITPVVNREPRAAEVLGLPRGNVAYASLIVGHPQIRYRRAIDRSLKGVAYV